MWYDPESKRYLIVDEPYDQRVEHKRTLREGWCQYLRYTMAQPQWPGMYAPDLGSRMVLFSGDEKGLPLGPVVTALNALLKPVVASARPGELKALEPMASRRPLIQPSTDHRPL